jgi:hypothetical protein
MPDLPLPTGDGPRSAGAILAEEQLCGLYPFDGRHLSVELEEIRACMDGIAGERAIKAGQLL